VRVKRSTHKRAAALLASVAMSGLVIAPAVHSELHLREQARAKERAVALVFRLAFDRGASAAQKRLLQQAEEEAFGSGDPEAGYSSPRHRHGPRGHSHGPRALASASLEHLGAAIHAPPPSPRLPRPPAARASDLPAPVALLLSPRYSTPERSQAPPPVV
jgi:hypothetical protein